MFGIPMPFLIAFAVLTAIVVAPAFAVHATDLVIEAPWARASIGVSRPAAAYVTVRNTGVAPDVLEVVRTPVAELAQVHRSEVKDGVAKMSPAGNVEVAAGSTVRLEPGGLHIMLMKLKQALKKGDTISMTLFFENAGPIDVIVPVYGIGASSPTISD